jgi:DNA processing protein
MHLDDAQRLDWLQLIRSDNVGPRTFRALLDKFGTARGALDALPDLLARQRGERAIRLFSRDKAEREYREAQRRGISFVALGEADYPAWLGRIDAAPPLIAIRGAREILAKPAIALVGSRNASAAGLAFVERLARGLGEEDFITVSGVARGIDAAVHRASLRRGTIGVLAGGHARPYPAEHAPLLDAIAETGVVISEMPLEWEPRGRDFPRRNRIVSGLSLATVVIEAARRSGSLITARLAAEQGREVFAVPGSPLDPRAEGTNDLLRTGATLCTRVADIVEGVMPMLADPSRTGLFDAGSGASGEYFCDEADLFVETGMTRDDGGDDNERDAQDNAPRDPADMRETVEGLLGPSPVSVDDLVRASRIDVAQVRSILLDLELAGRIERHGGNLVSRTR